MPLVTCTASHFRTGGPRGPLHLTFSWAELIWAAVTVGKWRDDLFANGRYSDYEAVSRIALHWAYLRTDAADRLVRTDAYDELDPTEKAGVSYAIGMSTTKLFGTRELGVPWLMHVDRYRTTFGLRLLPGRSRPDLVGPRDPDTRLDWIVAEAKGRTHGLARGDVGLLRQQKRRVVTIAGKRPVLRVGSVAHFGGGLLEVRVVDPARGRRHELFEESVTDVKRGFAAAYYGPFIELLAEDDLAVRTDESAVVRELPLADAAVGMSQHQLERLRRYIQGSGEDLELEAETGRREPRLTGGRSRYVGADGIVVELGDSWSDEAMSLSPRERTRP